MFVTLKNVGYDFKGFLLKYQRLLYQLSEPENSWQPNAFELIVFEEWVLAKSLGKEYDHQEVMAKMKRRYQDGKTPFALMSA